MIRSILAASLFAAVSATAMSAQAGPLDVYADLNRYPASVKVSVGDRSADPQATQALYSRLRRAAREACNSGVSNRRVRQEDAACARRALNQTVAQLSRPTLTAVHHDRTARTEGYATGF